MRAATECAVGQDAKGIQVMMTKVAGCHAGKVFMDEQGA